MLPVVRGARGRVARFGLMSLTIGALVNGLTLVLAAVPAAAGVAVGSAFQGVDPLPSWNATGPKKAILEFVARATQADGADFVPPEDRLAVFDNDGTLWSEQPMYTQFHFMLDRVKTLAPAHPEWKDDPAFKAAIDGDAAALAALPASAVVKLAAAAQAGVTTEAFDELVLEWIAKAKSPKYGRPYTELVYQPMLELLTYLRDHGFKTYIVTGGGLEFVRPWARQVYGVPPEQVIGTVFGVKYELQGGKPVLVRQPNLVFVDDKEGKPAAIHAFTGKRPHAAFGNSDGDLEMLQWTAARSGPKLALLIHHTDAAREAAYDRASSVGKLDKALDEAKRSGWTIVDMKSDWKYVFPFELPKPRSVPIAERWSGTILLTDLASLPEDARECPTGCLRDAAELGAVWKRVKPGEPVPTVDFEKNFVVFARNQGVFSPIYIAAVKWVDRAAEVVTSTSRDGVPLADKASIMLAVIPRADIDFIACRGRKHSIVK
jgi:phosphoserine phosphatase